MWKRTARGLLTCAVMSLLVSALHATEPAPSTALAKYEVRFMEGMTDHHEMAIEMAGMCLQKAVHDELKAVCQNIVSTQQSEQAQMLSWLSDWYDVAYQPQMMRGDQQMMRRMHTANGADFEIMFLKNMIRHHWSAVIEASTCVDRAYHDQLVTLCTQIIEAQTAEIRQLRQWLCQWYGICNYGPKGRRSEP